MENNHFHDYQHHQHHHHYKENQKHLPIISKLKKKFRQFMCVFSTNHIGNLSSNQTPVPSTAMSNETNPPSHQESSENRSALLQSICDFKKASLKKMA